MKQTKITSHDGKQIAMYVWNEVPNPKAVVKIAHGMVEHSARYDDFAKYLNSRGYIVVMNDHRGHGLTAEKDSLGYEEGDMWSNNVGDQLFLIDYCKKTYGLPVYMMGHSYGSFITQAVINRNPDVKGFVLVGSNYMKGLDFWFCRIVANDLCRNKGPRQPADIIVKLSFGMYEKRIPGKNNWLNRDEAEVKKYSEDPFCSYNCSANFYRTFMNGIRSLYNKQSIAEMSKQPVLIVAGSNDPVGNYGKGVDKLTKFYKNKAKLSDVTEILYPDARHELLNELCKQQAYADIADWLDSHLA